MSDKPKKLTVADLRPGVQQRVQPRPPQPPQEQPQPPQQPKPPKNKQGKPKHGKKKPPQIQAPPGELTAAQRERRKRKHRRNRKNRMRPMLPAMEALQAELQATYPQAFGAWRRPLAIGIHHAIIAELGCDPILLREILRHWMRAPAYLIALTRGKHRYGLDGAQVAEITDAERADAVRRLALVKALKAEMKARYAHQKRAA